MKDRPHIVLVKAVARFAWAAELWLRRRLLSRWRRRFWRLSGECNACGACCVEPSIRASVLVWYVPIVRRLFLAWQRRVNGFELARAEAESHDLVFRCGHYDPASRRCDSYATRPSMCRDYPTVLLDQPWPELFEGCSHRVLARQPAGLAAQIDATSLSAEAKRDLRRKMRLE
jgi:Fe-S-cluster containining protein